MSSSATPDPGPVTSGSREPSSRLGLSPRRGPSSLRDPEGFVVWGLGANLGDRESSLLRAIESLREAFGPLRIASPFRTAPVSDIPQREYLNTVAVARLDGLRRCFGLVPVDAADTARRLVASAKALELRAGRRCAGERNGPRPLDVDLLLFGSHELCLPALDTAPTSSSAEPAATPSPAVARVPGAQPSISPWSGPVIVPHPRMRERRFVLAPLAELLPRLELPPDGAAVADLLERLERGPGSGQRVERLRWSRDPWRGNGPGLTKSPG